MRRGKILDTYSKPPRVVGLGGAVLINLNGVIGAGIFALPALLYANAGSFAPVAILGFGLLYACIMAIGAKLSTVFRQSGGAQLYAQHAFGRVTGFQIGWFNLSANMAGRAANFHVMVSYIAALFPLFEGPTMRALAIIALIAGFMTIGIIGTVRSIRALWVGTLFKMAPLLLLCVAGLVANGVPSDIVLPQFSEIEAVVLLLAYAFSGAGTVIVAAGEAKEPRSMIMRSIFLNLAGVTFFYALVQLSYMAIAPDPGELDVPLAAAGSQLFGPLGTLIISIAAIFSIGTNQLNSFIAMPRITFGMARRGLLPRIFAYVSPRFHTPSIAIAIYSLLVAALALSGSFVLLATLVVAVEQLIFIIMIGAFLVMWRRNDGGLADTVGLRWLFIVPIAIGFVIWMTLQVPVSSAVSTLALVGVGFLLYFVSRIGAVEHEPVILPERRA